MFKLVLLGDAGVGKSALVLRFVRDEWSESSESTIGAAFLSKSFSVDRAPVRCEIWDTAGQERYRALAPMYYRGAAAALIVYDITSLESFEGAKRWVRELQRTSEPGLVIALCANKADLAHARKVGAAEGAAFAAEGGLLFLETSARSGVNVNEVFMEVRAPPPPWVVAAASGGWVAVVACGGVGGGSGGSGGGLPWLRPRRAHSGRALPHCPPASQHPPPSLAGDAPAPAGCGRALHRGHRHGPQQPAQGRGGEARRQGGGQGQAGGVLLINTMRRWSESFSGRLRVGPPQFAPLSLCAATEPPRPPLEPLSPPPASASRASRPPARSTRRRFSSSRSRAE